MLPEVELSTLPDKRLKERLSKLLEGFQYTLTQSIPEAFGEWKKTKAAYRFFSNERVEHRALVEGQREATRERIVERGDSTVLMIQDTTSFNFKHHPAVEGMGPLENAHTNGFLVHSTLAVSEDGVPLGLWEQQVWVREVEEIGKSQQRHERAFREKESYKWVTGLPEIEEKALAETLINICDRESHIYEFFDEVLKRDLNFIVRASKGRSFSPEGVEIFQILRQMPPQQAYTLNLKRRPDRPAREAKVELRYGSVTLKRPKRADTERESLTLQVVEVIEPSPPDGQEAVHWVLLTNLPIETLEQAQKIVEYYTYRWLIERFHYVLKSGCRLEERQLQKQKRLERLLAVFNLLAWQLLWLTYQARKTPEESCLVALSQEEWQALYIFTHRSNPLPATPPTLGEVVRWIAQLGGFLGRKNDGEPGVKVLWRGLSRLQDIVDSWILFHSLPLNHDVGKA